MSKERMRNSTRIEGMLYQHKLEERITGENSAHPGTKYIRGSIDVATDDECLNIITVYYTYVTATTKSGAPNENYGNLMNIINKTLGCYMEVGKEKAAKIRVDSSVGVNDFYSNRNGTEELVSAKRNDGGFIRVVNSINEDEKQRSTFDCDMIINNVRHMDEDAERGLKARSIVSGYVFDFRKAILPVDFTASNPGAMRYFEGLGASEKNPVFTRVKGQQIANEIKRTITEESAFGDPIVRELSSTRKDFEITWAQPEEYEWNTPETYTEEELKEALANREVYLAGVRSRNAEYGSGRTGTASAFNNIVETPANKSSAMEFDF